MCEILRYEEVSPEELQEIFNRDVYPLIETGSFELVMQYERQVKKGLPDNCPPGTRTRIRRYKLVGGCSFAVTHCYVRPDGSVGASHREDPKTLVSFQVRYDLPHDPVSEGWAKRRRRSSR